MENAEYAKQKTSTTTAGKADKTKLPNNDPARTTNHTAHIRRHMGKIQEQTYPKKNTPPDLATHNARRNIQEDIQQIRVHSQLNQTIQKHPQIEQMPTQPYGKKKYNRQ